MRRAFLRQLLTGYTEIKKESPMTAMTSDQVAPEQNPRSGTKQRQAENAVRVSEWLCQRVAREPEILGYRKDSTASAFKMTEDGRASLEKAIIEQGQYGFHEALEVLVGAEPWIDLVIFDRYHDLMEPKRLESTVEDIISGRRRGSRALHGLGYALEARSQGNISEHDFHLTVAALEGLGAHRFYSSGQHVANMGRKSASYEKNMVKDLEAYAEGLKYLLDRGLTNILGSLSRKPDYPMFCSFDSEKISSYRNALPVAMVLAHDKEKHAFNANELSLSAHGVVFSALLTLAQRLDVEGIEALARNFDLSKTFAALAADKPLRLSADKVLSAKSTGFSPMLAVACMVERLNRMGSTEAYPLAYGRATSIVQTLLHSGLSDYTSEPAHCAVIANWVDVEVAKYGPDFLKLLDDTFNLPSLVKNIPNEQLFGKSRSGVGYCHIEFWRRLEQGREFLKDAIGGMPVAEQEALFSNKNIMDWYRVTHNDRRYATSERVMEDLLSTDLGL
jgi:hypothetical protein